MRHKKRSSNRQAPRKPDEIIAPVPVPRRHDVLAVAALILLPIVLLWRAALLRGFLVQSDICYQFEPFNAFLHEAVRAGRLPLWSPYIFCGYPIAAEGQIAAFYPPALLVGWLLPSPGAVNWTIISHAILAAVSMYLLARRLGLTAFAAWLAAFVFSFSGYFFSHIHHVGLFRASAWIPVVLIFIDRAWHERPALNSALASLAWAAAALCGHPQTLFFISLASVVWIAGRLLGLPRASRASALPKAAGILALLFVLGCGVSAVQLLLTADLQSRAPHGDVGSLEYVTSFSLLPRHLLGLFAPNWQGSPAFNSYRGERYYWEYVLYVGIAPLLLALIGASTRRGRIWLGLALVALILALAQGNPLYHVLRLLPGFGHFRAPARYIVFFTFAAALLAGCGWDRIRLARALKPGRRATLVGALVALLTVADLFWFDRTLAPLSSPAVYQATPAVVEAVKEDPTWSRSFILPPINIFADWSPPGGWAANPDGWLEARVYLPASVPQSFGLSTVGGYAGFTDPGHELFFQKASEQTFAYADHALYSLVGTRYFVIGPKWSIGGLPEADIPPFRVYRNPDSFPRTFAVGSVVAASTRADALAQTQELARQGRLADAAVVHGDLSYLGPVSGTGNILHVDEPRPERVVVSVQSREPTLVVLNERWDPGWRARVDGMGVPLVEVDSILMGASMPAGEHTVEFEYRPSGLILGRALSLASLGVFVLIVAASALRLRRGRTPAS